jgi:hypothetical protein
MVPGGDPYASMLELPRSTPITLVAHFQQIPEPLSLTVMGIGLTLLGLRRRRRC